MTNAQIRAHVAIDAIIAQSAAKSCHYESLKFWCRSLGERAYWQRQAAIESKKARVALFQLIGDGSPEEG